MYPKWKYHPRLPGRIVADEQEERALGGEWSDFPCGGPPSDGIGETAAFQRRFGTKRSEPAAPITAGPVSFLDMVQPCEDEEVYDPLQMRRTPL